MKNTALAFMPSEPGQAAPAGGIPLCVPEIRGKEWEYVKECLDSSWVSSVGPFVDRFEETVASYVGTRHAVACVNGTSALHVALLAAGVEPDDEVLVSALSFIAPANAIRYAGAWPVFIDAEPRYWQMDANAVVEFVNNNCRRVDGELRNHHTGRRVRAILPVHILGHPVDMDPILEVASKYALPVIEDATESLGAKYRGRKVGSLGHIACFSFNGNKIITTGGGGMITTNDDGLAQRMKYLTTQAKDDPVEFIHGTVGFNFRLTNVLAAIGVAQMELLDEYVAIKRKIARRYAEEFAVNPAISCMTEAEDVFSTFWLSTILIDEEKAGRSSRSVLQYLDRNRIQARPLWQPLNQSPAYAGWSTARCPVAERLNRQSLSLPCSVGLTASQQDRVIETVFAALA